MMNKIVLILFALMPFLMQAQDSTQPEMAELFRSEGKIYVVIAVISIVFVCLIAYLIYIDIKLKKLENRK